MRIAIAERHGLQIEKIAEFMDDFNKSLVVDEKLIYVLGNEDGEWVETFCPVKFKCKSCGEWAGDIESSEMEFETECPHCKASRETK